MSWFKKPGNIVVVGIGALIAIIALVAVIWGVSTHTEAGLLEVCWVDGQAHYVEGAEDNDGSCEGPEELVWPAKQIPLSVMALSPTGEALVPGSSDWRSIEAAINDINAQVGFTILRYVASMDDASVVVGFGGGVAAGSGRSSKRPTGIGAATHTKRGPADLYCHVTINSAVGSERMAYLVGHHELLHCIGLGHDSDNRASAIYPLTRDDTMEERMSAARITDHDRELIRTLYRR